jgi:hypothetical protein
LLTQGVGHTIGLIIGLFHALLAVRARVEIHRLRTHPSRRIQIVRESDPTLPLDLENPPTGDPTELANDEKKNPPHPGPVIVPVEINGGAGMANLYMVNGPDGRSQLLMPVGMQLMAVQADDGQPQQVVGSVEAGSTAMYELPAEVRGNELYVGQRAEMHGISWQS